jgi:hypothetical protein
MKEFNWWIFTASFLLLQFCFVGVYYLIRKYQRRKRSKEEVLNRMCARGGYSPRYFEIDPWRTSILGLGFLLIQRLTGKK